MDKVQNKNACPKKFACQKKFEPIKGYSCFFEVNFFFIAQLLLVPGMDLSLISQFAQTQRALWQNGNSGPLASSFNKVKQTVKNNNFNCILF